MPSLIEPQKELTRKRKREGRGLIAMPTNGVRPVEDGKREPDVGLLEDQITQSRRYLNNIATLIGYVRTSHNNAVRSSQAVVALCRIFSRLLASGSMTRSSHQSEGEIVVVEWLHNRLGEYRSLLLDLVAQSHNGEQKASLELLMHLAKEEATSLKMDANTVWRRGTFPLILRAVVSESSSEQLRRNFVKKYIQDNDDLLLYSLKITAQILSDADNSGFTDGIIFIMKSVKLAGDDLENPASNLYFELSPRANPSQYSLKSQKRAAQAVWVLLLKSVLTKAQRKTLLGSMSTQTAPCFTKPELLMDFLVDSFDTGGSTSLMALSGLFYLIKEKNLDYPLFYQKLYSLLDSTVLHSKHRSKFFRLLDTSLSSTHLPAALVASFIKRLSRLCLHSPPSGIVVIIPWIYNLLKRHPTCTFMIHREVHIDSIAFNQPDTQGMDPFSMEEADPMATGAIESSLWEIETLQSHYHPNIATIAKIISEQFLKQEYNTEDFLDHSYGSMLEAELSRPHKKHPVIEFEIPKTIFTANPQTSSATTIPKLQLFDFST